MLLRHVFIFMLMLLFATTIRRAIIFAIVYYRHTLPCCHAEEWHYPLFDF